MPESNTPIGRARLSLDGEPREMREACGATEGTCARPFTEAAAIATPGDRLRIDNPSLAALRPGTTPRPPANGSPLLELLPRFAIV
jgi:hypothetical protein